VTPGRKKGRGGPRLSPLSLGLGLRASKSWPRSGFYCRFCFVLLVLLMKVLCLDVGRPPGTSYNTKNASGQEEGERGAGGAVTGYLGCGGLKQDP
jgi:hypothetical protein